MSYRLATVATFWNPVEANLARNLLDEAGIRAFLADEQMVGMVWQLANAAGGIKLQVEDRDAEKAALVLADWERPEQLGADQDHAAQPASGEEQPPEVSWADMDEPEPVPTQREQDADRALRSAVLGLLFWPLQLYTLWLLLKVLASHERLNPGNRRRATIAAIINVPFILGCGLLLRAMLSR